MFSAITRNRKLFEVVSLLFSNSASAGVIPGALQSSFSKSDLLLQKDSLFEMERMSSREVASFPFEQPYFQSLLYDSCQQDLYKPKEMLAALRVNQKFPEFRTILPKIVERIPLMALKPAADTVAATFIFDQFLDSDNVIVGHLTRRMKELKTGIPKSVWDPIDIQLKVLRNEEISLVVQSIISDGVRADDILGKLTLVAALRQNNFNCFKQLFSYYKDSDRLSPVVLFWVLNYAFHNQEKKHEVSRWYGNFLAEFFRTVDSVHFEIVTQPLMRVTNCVLREICIGASRELFLKNSRQSVIGRLPPPAPVNNKLFTDMKNDFSNFIQTEFHRKARFMEHEVNNIKRIVKSAKLQATNKNSAVIVDFLNLSSGGVHNFEQRKLHFLQLLLRLEEQFKTVIIVSRKHHSKIFAEYAKSEKWSRGNIHTVLVSNVSEDDILTLFGALLWGPGCYIVSNDRFRNYFIKIENPEVKEFAMTFSQQRILRHINSEIQSIANFDRTIKWLNAESKKESKSSNKTDEKRLLFIPVKNEHSHIPEFRYFVVDL